MKDTEESEELYINRSGKGVFSFLSVVEPIVNFMKQVLIRFIRSMGKEYFSHQMLVFILFNEKKIKNMEKVKNFSQTEIL